MFQRMLVKGMYKTNPLSQAPQTLKFGLRMAAWMGGRYEPTMALQSVRLDCAMAAQMEAVERGTKAQQYVIHKWQAAPQIRKPWGLNGSLNKLVQAMAMCRGKVSRASVQAVHAHGQPFVYDRAGHDARLHRPRRPYFGSELLPWLRRGCAWPNKDTLV